MKFSIISKLLVIGVLLTQSAWADDAAILSKLQELEQEVKILKRQLENNKEDSDKKAKESAVVTANAKDGFSIKSPDNAFKLRLRGLFQADGRFYLNNEEDISSPDTFLLRRVRPIVEGNVGERFTFNITPDFAGSSVALQDAYGEWKFSDQFKLRSGKFKSPFGLERLQSSASTNFVELGLPSNLTPNYDVGVQLSGDGLDQRLSYAVAAFDGTIDNTSVDTDNNNDKDLAARIFAQPFKTSDIEALNGLGFGVAVSYGDKDTTSVPTYKSPGQSNIFKYGSTVNADGGTARISPQFYYYEGPFSLLGEYVESKQDVSRPVSGILVKDSFRHSAWQLAGTYVLTGENASYKGVTPRKPFDWSKRQWGAFELAGRYGEIDFDNAAFTSGFSSASTYVSQANEWALGLNWYLSPNVKFVINFDQTVYQGGASGGKDRETENVILSRFQIAY